jgi:hypothetical protein
MRFREVGHDLQRRAVAVAHARGVVDAQRAAAVRRAEQPAAAAVERQIGMARVDRGRADARECAARRRDAERDDGRLLAAGRDVQTRAIGLHGDRHHGVAGRVAGERRQRTVGREREGGELAVGGIRYDDGQAISVRHGGASWWV